MVMQLTKYYLSFICLLIISAHRITETFFSSKGKGHKKRSWTLATLTILYGLIIIVTILQNYFIISINFLVSVSGLVLYVIGLFLRTKAIATLGKFHSPDIEIYSDQKIISSGPYKYIRHPIYAGIILEVIAIPIIFNAYLGLLISLFLYIPVLIYRLIEEERMLEKHFKEKYKIYKQNVGAIFPKIK